MKTALRIRPHARTQPELRVPLGKPFLEQLDGALAQVDPRVCAEVRWLANLGLVIEAERVLIDYLASDTRPYEIQVEQEELVRIHQLDSIAMAMWCTCIVDCNVLGTFAACMTWVCRGS